MPFDQSTSDVVNMISGVEISTSSLECKKAGSVFREGDRNKLFDQMYNPVKWKTKKRDELMLDRRIDKVKGVGYNVSLSHIDNYFHHFSHSDFIYNTPYLTFHNCSLNFF